MGSIPIYIYLYTTARTYQKKAMAHDHTPCVVHIKTPSMRTGSWVENTGGPVRVGA